jgi:cytochrome b6-f complex iron-sulfur subunit
MAEPTKKAEKGVSRRDFFSLIGWGSFLATLGGSTIGAYKFMFPNVLYEPPTIFKIGKPEEYPMGVTEKWKKEGQFWVVRNERGIYGMISICRHLGCTPNWFSDQDMFRCPCHGSIYDPMGNVRGGPAPKTLWRPSITVDPVDKQLIVNTGIRQDPDPKSTAEGLMVDEALREVEPFFVKV